MNKNDWLIWRSKGIGSSDAPIVMGVSPYMTPYQLWEIKCRLRPSPPGNWATDRGNEMEPRARARYELKYGVDMPPKLIEHADFPWMRASLDGRNAELRRVLEIKCPGKAEHEAAKSGIVPPKYWPQVQHQLMVSGDHDVHFASYYETLDDNGEVIATDLAVVEVLPDAEYQLGMFKTLLEFWQLVQTRTPPPMVPKDTCKVRDEKVLGPAAAYAEAWRAATAAAVAAKFAMNELVDAIEARSGNQPRLIMRGLLGERTVCGDRTVWAFKEEE